MLHDCSATHKVGYRARQFLETNASSKRFFSSWRIWLWCGACTKQKVQKFRVATAENHMSLQMCSDVTAYFQMYSMNLSFIVKHHQAPIALRCKASGFHVYVTLHKYSKYNVNTYAIFQNSSSGGPCGEAFSTTWAHIFFSCSCGCSSASPTTPGRSLVRKVQKHFDVQRSEIPLLW